MRSIPTLFFCIAFIICALLVLCFIISAATQNKNKHLGFKKIMEIAFSDLSDEIDDLGVFFVILVICFIWMIIAVPASCSKAHAHKEAQYYYEKCVTLSEQIKKADVSESKEELSEDLKSYNIAVVNKDMAKYEEAKRNLDYWYRRANK
jgi:hypothetical protein